MNDKEMFSNESPRSYQRSLRSEKTWAEVDELEDENELDFETY